MTITPEEIQKSHNEGQKDGSEGRVGPLSEPWPSIFEEKEDFRAREEAYKKGWDNGNENPAK